MARSDETYLEAFIEHISTLPAEIRRNLDLMKDLDKTSSILFDEMVALHQGYVSRVERNIGRLEVEQNGKKIRILGTEGDSTAIIPTTEELIAYIKEPVELRRIEAIQDETLQQAEEKVAIAEQTYRLVDNICKRLDADLEDMKRYLLSAGEFQKQGTVKPNDLAAIQVNPGSSDWILAKVMSHDAQTGMYRLSDEDIESNKIFHLPESQVVILGNLKNLSRGDTVFAVYPDTTSFYQATVVQIVRKVSGGGSFVMVNFVDDSDEHGITHDKAVLLHHVMRPPFGALLQ